LVNFNVVIDLASEYDLELIQTETFNQFFPDFPDVTLSPPMAAYSSIHRSFRFRKISRSKTNGLVNANASITNIQRIQHIQLETRSVNDDRNDSRAADSAYHISSIVGKLNVSSLILSSQCFECLLRWNKLTINLMMKSQLLRWWQRSRQRRESVLVSLTSL